MGNRLKLPVIVSLLVPNAKVAVDFRERGRAESTTKGNISQVLVAQACNLSNSGGRYQEDHGSKPAQANSPRDPILKKLITKKDWWSGSRCRP
jgi:hypothetical protein